MSTDEKQCIEFWQNLAGKIKRFDKLDDAEIVFGARTNAGGHQYRRLPIVTDKEIAFFERNNGFDLPIEYKTYLQTFGAGGAGPYYGIYDFRKHVLDNTYNEPFPYNEEIWYSDVDDDDPIWEYDGIAFIGDIGCGAVFGIELNGQSPGRIWADWADACTPRGTLIEFYHKWIDKVENGLERYHLLKSFMNGEKRINRPKGVTLDDVVGLLQCKYEDWQTSGTPMIQEGERWISFNKTPARIILDGNDVVLSIEIFDKSSIT